MPIVISRYVPKILFKKLNTFFFFFSFSFRRSSIGTCQWNSWSLARSSGVTPAHKYPAVFSFNDGALTNCSRQQWSSAACWLSALPLALITAAGRRWSPSGRCAASFRVPFYRVYTPCCLDGRRQTSAADLVSAHSSFFKVFSFFFFEKIHEYVHGIGTEESVGT